MKLKTSTIFWIVALILAWVFDQLFWEKPMGVSFLIFVLLCLAGGFYLTWRETEGFSIIRPPFASLALLLPVVFFALVTFLRQEPLTVFAGFSLALAGMLALAFTWLGGRWWQYTVSDYLANFFRWLGGTLSEPGKRGARQIANSGQRAVDSGQLSAVSDQSSADSGMGAEAGKEALAPEALTPEALTPALSPGSNLPRERGREARRNGLRIAGSVGVGLMLALPVVLVLATLLAEADPIFKRQITHLFDFLSFEKLAEYIFRSIYILIAAYLLAGTYLYAVFSSPGEKVSEGEPWFKPFLGWIEAVTLLGCVDALFAFFVSVQFRYFFGGRANIAAEGFTYSEYARRGFGELVAVAFLSLMLFLGLEAITRRTQQPARRAFTGLGILLVALVGVILVSAFQRLMLYEAAYGFSRLRTYTHVFMVWLGLLLLVTLILEASGRMRFFALAAVLAVIGFGVSLPLLNVDAFIVRHNVSRALAGEAQASDDASRLDSAYFSELSDDAIPALFDLYQQSSLPPALHEELGGALACKAKLRAEPARKRPWQSFHLARYRADQLFAQFAGELQGYAMQQGEYSRWQVQVNGEWRDCQADWYMD